MIDTGDSGAQAPSLVSKDDKVAQDEYDESLESSMFGDQEPPQGEALKALQEKFGVVSGDSRDLAVMYIDIEMGQKFPSTKYIFCQKC